jgi:DNA-binding MarR family transcriptional regulator
VRRPERSSRRLYRLGYLNTVSHQRAQIGEAVFGLASLLIRQRSRDLSLTAGSTLGTLERTGPRRLGDLALQEGIAQPSMTALVDQLEQLGLVERRPDPDDGRAVLVAIAPDGRKHLDVLREVAAAGFAALIGQLPDEDVAALVAAVPAMNHLIDLATGRRLSEEGAKAKSH